MNEGSGLTKVDCKLARLIRSRSALKKQRTRLGQKKAVMAKKIESKGLITYELYSCNLSGMIKKKKRFLAGKYVLRKGSKAKDDRSEIPLSSRNESSSAKRHVESPAVEVEQAMEIARSGNPNALQLHQDFMRPMQNLSSTMEFSEIRELDSTFIQRILDFTYAEEFNSANIYALQTRLELLDTRWKKFEAEYLRSLNMPLEEGNAQSHNQRFFAAEEAYVEAKATLCSKIDSLKASPVEKGLTDRNVVRQLGDILSQDKLPVFKGDFTQWATFRDLFRIEVHENPNFTNSQKLKKLLNALDGAAKRAVGDWRITEGQGYEDAWKALTRQYDNDYRTIRAHLQKIHELKPMRSASCEDMNESLYTVRNAQRNLQSMLTADRLSDYQFLHKLEAILDEDSKREWEMRRDANTLPTLAEMFEFLERRTMFLSGLAATTGHYRSTVPEHKAVTHTDGLGRASYSAANQSMQNRRNNQNIVNRSTKSSWTSAEKCIKCGKNCYALFRCNEFEALTLVERAQFVADKLLCRICFSSRHKTDQCYKVGCQKPQCGERHNSFLCPLNARFKTSQSTKKEATVASVAASTTTA